MKAIKICITGNSVALRIRPPHEYPENKNYTSLLAEKLNQRFSDYRFLVENKSIGADTVQNIYEKIDSIIHCFPDMYILNIGVVDACTREVPLWFFRLATRRNEDLISVFFRAFYRGLIAKIRPFLVILRGERPWISKRKFEKYFSLIAETLQKETNSKIIVLPINLTNSRVERMLPGSRKNQIKYNTILKQIADDYNLSFIELNDLDPVKHYPDGIHYSSSGHQIVSDRILSKIVEVMQLS